jgi:hypothetical protein
MSLFPLGLLSQGGGAAAGSFELIETQVLGSNVASVTFSSIPATYKHLQLRYTAQTNSNQSILRGRFNGDSTSANYSRHYLYGDGSSVGSSASANNGWLDFGPLEVGTNLFTAGIVDVLDYTSTNKNKTIRALAGRAGSANRNIALSSGGWFSASAVTSLTVSEAFFGQNLLTGSRFSLYGIQG